MRVLYVLFVAIVVAAANEEANDCGDENIISNKCVPNNDCLRAIGSNETQHIPYPPDCHKFYKCSEGKACVMCCPKMDSTGKRLVFNPKLQVCDWPENVKDPKATCDNLNPTEPSTTSTEPSTTSTEPSTTSTKPTATPTKPTATPTKPTATPTKPTAPPTKPTAPPTKPTVPPTKPSSTSTKITTSSTESPRLPNGCPSDGSTDNIEDKENCRKFYSCKNGLRKGPYPCGEGLVFNPNISSCDRPENYPSCELLNSKYFDN